MSLSSVKTARGEFGGMVACSVTTCDTLSMAYPTHNDLPSSLRFPVGSRVRLVKYSVHRDSAKSWKVKRHFLNHAGVEWLEVDAGVQGLCGPVSDFMGAKDIPEPITLPPVTVSKIREGMYEVEIGGRFFFIARFSARSWCVEYRDAEGITAAAMDETIHFLKEHAIKSRATRKALIAALVEATAAGDAKKSHKEIVIEAIVHSAADDEMKEIKAADLREFARLTLEIMTRSRESKLSDDGVAEFYGDSHDGPWSLGVYMESKAPQRFTVESDEETFSYHFAAVACLTEERKEIVIKLSDAPREFNSQELLETAEAKAYDEAMAHFTDGNFDLIDEN